MFKNNIAKLLIFSILSFSSIASGYGQEGGQKERPNPTFKGWKTNLENRSIELLSGGQAKNHIPAIVA